jgi:ComF family protein
MYENPTVKTVLHQLKFGRTQALAKPIAVSLAAICPTGIITHVPTAPRRVRQRGYDQAQRIAKNLAHHTGYQYTNMFIRTSNKRQLGQSRKTRQQQLANAFQLRNNRLPPSMPIILVDDVLTTGSTIEAAAQILRHAGYEQIHACIFAWASLPTSHTI